MHQPAILRRRVLRLTVGIVLIAALAFVFIRFFSDIQSADPGDFQSDGYIAALLQVGDGEQAVMIDPNGNVVKSPGYSEGAMDQPPAWQPDGQRLYFASDREREQSHLFRWNPARNLVEQRTIDKRTKSWLIFDQSEDDKDPMALMGSGGSVVAVEPRVPHSRQLMPPRGSNEANPAAEGGATSAFEQLYNGIGTSVKYAVWAAGRNYLLAVMRREEGEILVAQKMYKTERPVDPTDLWKIALTEPPIIVVAADRVDLDYCKATGVAVYTCQGFQFPKPEMVPPELKKNGKIQLPFQHIIGMYKPGDPGLYQNGPTNQAFISLGKDNQFAFASPKISPDGSEVACQVGKYEGSGVIDPQILATMKTTPGGGQESRTLVGGPVLDMSWHPNSRLLLFVAEVEGERSIFSITSEGADPKNLTKGKGNFRSPVWSPVTKTKG